MTAPPRFVDAGVVESAVLTLENSTLRAQHRSPLGA
jgi:hypothetical protein